MSVSAYRRGALFLAAAAALLIAGYAVPDTRSSSPTPLVMEPHRVTPAEITDDPDDPDADTWEYAADLIEVAGGTLRRATSVHLVLSAEMNGVPEELDLRLDRDGHGEGRIRVGRAGSAEVVLDGDDYYLKPDHALLRRLLPGRAGGLDGEWLQFPTSEVESFAPVTMEQLIDSIELPEHDAPWRLVDDDRTYAGRKTFQLEVLDEGLKVFVAADGAAEIVGVQGRYGDDRGTLTFSDWNEPVTVTPPADPIPMRSVTYEI